MITIGRKTTDHVIEEILDVMINNEQSCEISIECVGELNEMLLNMVTKLLTWSITAVVAACQRYLAGYAPKWSKSTPFSALPTCTISRDTRKYHLLLLLYYHFSG